MLAEDGQSWGPPGAQAGDSVTGPYEGEGSCRGGLGLQNLDMLSVISTDTAELPPCSCRS